jgi:hypothetical protein
VTVLERPAGFAYAAGRNDLPSKSFSIEKNHSPRETAMNLSDLNKVAQAMVAPGKGLLAADESGGTIKKRFDAIKVESTEDTRRD